VTRTPRHSVTDRDAWIPSAVPFFLFGFLYYLISPAFVFHFLSADSELLDNATRYLDSNYFQTSYYLDAVVILLSFLVGYFLARAGTKRNRSIADFGSLKTSIPKILALSFGVLILYFGISARTSGTAFFTGYSTYDMSVLGPFSTCAFLSAWFVNYFLRNQIRFVFLSFFVVCSVLLLGWGSRMYFVLSFMALMLGLLSKNKWLLRNIWFYLFIAISCVLMMAVGIVREGGRELGSENLIAVFFAEPLFTSVSGSLYLDANGGRPVYGVPNDLLAAIIHFVPSAIFPGKIDLIREITFNQNVQSPFGAKSLLVGLYSNFGVFYPIFIASIGIYFGFLSRKARHSVFYRAVYFSALPVLTFLFYREGLTTVIKVLFFNGFMVPLIIALSLVWLFPRPTIQARGRYSHTTREKKSTQGNQGTFEPESE